MSPIIENLRHDLSVNSNEQLQKSTQHFFREGIICYGIKSATVGTIGKEHFKTIRGLPKAEIFVTADDLFFRLHGLILMPPAIQVHLSESP